MEPLVSVMLPVREAAGTLEGAVRSCLEQTLSDFELLLVPNDETPATAEVVERLRKEDSRVRVVSCPRGGGFIRALNLGWASARGRYLARMDADDLAEADRLRAQVRFLEGRPDLMGCGSLVRILRRETSGELKGPRDGYQRFEAWLNAVVEPESIHTERFVDSPVANSSMMVRREVFASVGGYRERGWAEDYDFWLRVLEKGLVLGKVPEVLMTWVDHDERLTRNHERYRHERFIDAKCHFLARIPAVRERGVLIGGAGPTGKRLARGLERETVDVRAYVDVHPRRAGQRIGGVEVLADDAPLPEPRPVLIGGAGARGARERMRAWAKSAGFIEGRDFFCAT